MIVRKPEARSQKPEWQFHRGQNTGFWLLASCFWLLAYHDSHIVAGSGPDRNQEL